MAIYNGSKGFNSVFLIIVNAVAVQYKISAPHSSPFKWEKCTWLCTYWCTGWCTCQCSCWCTCAHADVQSCCMYFDVIHLMFYILDASITKVLKRFERTGHILTTTAIQVFRHEGKTAPPSSGKKLSSFLQVVLKQK